MSRQFEPCHRLEVLHHVHNQEKICLFERLPFPDVEPSYNTEAIVVSGAAGIYRIEIPALSVANTFSSLLFYINDRDSPVIMKNARVVAY